MSEQVTVELRIMDQIFRLATTEDKKDDLELAANMLNEKYQDMRRKAPRAENHKVSVMVALELMQEVLSMNKTLQEYAHCQRLIGSILQEIETVV